MRRLLKKDCNIGVFFLSFYIFLFSCTAWKTKKLQTKRTILIRYGKQCGEIGAIFKKRKIIEYPTEFFFSNDKFWVADVVNKRILAFDYLGHPVLCISTNENKTIASRNNNNNTKGFIKKFIVNRKEKFFIQKT